MIINILQILLSFLSMCVWIMPFNSFSHLVLLKDLADYFCLQRPYQPHTIAATIESCCPLYLRCPYHRIPILSFQIFYSKNIHTGAPSCIFFVTSEIVKPSPFFTWKRSLSAPTRPSIIALNLLGGDSFVEKEPDDCEESLS